jgi:hypothetical protein
MTDISKNNIVNRWKQMADADLGSLVSPVADEIGRFFQAMFEGDNGDGTYTTNAIKSDSKVAALIRGFEWSTGYNADDGLSVIFCIDLHSVTMDASVLREFDNYLMYSPTYHGCPIKWVERYFDLVKAA